MRTLQVALAERSYPIHIGEGLLDTFPLAEQIRGNQVMIITNETIAPLYLDKLVGQFAGVQCDTLILPDGEKFKTLETLETIFDALMEKRHSRTTTLIALGGGVVGDMVGFAAACYQRGVDFVQVPTTLLAQVDSSVGGQDSGQPPPWKEHDRGLLSASTGADRYVGAGNSACSRIGCRLRGSGEVRFDSGPAFLSLAGN